MKRGLCLGVLLLAACASATSPATQSLPIFTVTFTEVSAPPVAATATVEAATAIHQRPVYFLIATLDYGAHYLAVSEKIIYTNNSSDSLGELPLIVEADNLGGLFTLNSLTIDRGAQWDYEAGQITVTLARALQRGEQVALNIDYSLALPQVHAALGWTERQTNFVDWYPFIPPYLHGNWLINSSAPQGEHLAFESSDFEVQINLVNAPALMKIAAPAPSAQLAAESFVYRLENARRFSWSAGGHYSLESKLSGSGVRVNVYFFKEERDAAETSMRTAVQALDIYSELFGSYPYESLSIVECSFQDGMESDGLFFLDMSYFRNYDYTNANLLTTLSAHETAHNWWYGAVGNDPAQEPWLDEALSTYSELLFYEKAHPNDVEWWWGFRVNKWEPTGWVNSTIYDHAQFRPYVNAVYLRGARFLRDLRKETGDAAYFAFIKQYAVQGAGKIMTGEDFLRFLPTDEDLTSLVGEYFRPTD